jgi:hypothetical protein
MTESTDTPTRFPILGEHNRVERGQEYPASVSWRFVQPFAKRAAHNHSQSLKRLAERGGLSARELWCIAHGMGLREGFAACKTDAEAIAWLKDDGTGAAVDWRVR